MFRLLAKPSPEFTRFKNKFNIKQYNFHQLLNNYYNYSNITCIVVHHTFLKILQIMKIAQLKAETCSCFSSIANVYSVGRILNGSLHIQHKRMTHCMLNILMSVEKVSTDKRMIGCQTLQALTLWRRIFFFNFSTLCI